MPYIPVDHIDVLQSIHHALKPVSDRTDILSGEKYIVHVHVLYITVSATFPILSLTEKTLLKISETDT